MRGGREAADGARGDRAGRSAVWAEGSASPGAVAGRRPPPSAGRAALRVA